MSLTVTKSDGSSEAYIHTRVMATISAALSDAGSYNEQTVSALSEAVRMYIEDCRDDSSSSSHITSDELYSMILATLQKTGNGRAAELLKQHRINRQISRKRQMVLHCLKSHLPAEEQGQVKTECCIDSYTFNCKINDCPYLAIEPWNKSRLASNLKCNYKLTRNAARVVAANVEEKIFKLNISEVRSRLIKELILNELFSFRNAVDFIENKQPRSSSKSRLIDELPSNNQGNTSLVPNHDTE